MKKEKESVCVFAKNMRGLKVVNAALSSKLHIFPREVQYVGETKQFRSFIFLLFYFRLSFFS